MDSRLGALPDDIEALKAALGRRIRLRCARRGGARSRQSQDLR
jgi:hypothetical protein